MAAAVRRSTQPVSVSRQILRGVTPILLGALAAATPAFAGQDKTGAGDAPRDSRWAIFYGSTNAHPQFNDASKEIDRRVNLPFQLLFPGFGSVETFEDQSEEFKIWSPFLGVAYEIDERLEVYVQAGGSKGTVNNDGWYRAAGILPTFTDADFDRGNIFAGVGVNYFPRGFAPAGEYKGLKARLKAAKPVLGCAVNFNYLTFESQVTADLFGVLRVLDQEEKMRWRLGSINPSLAVEIPIQGNWSATAQGGYTYFFRENADFGGPSFSFIIKKRF